MTASLEEDEQTLWGSNMKQLRLCHKRHLTEFNRLYRTKTLLSTTTEVKHFVCWRLFWVPRAVALLIGRSFQFIFLRRSRHSCLQCQFRKNWNLLCTHGWNGWFDVSIFLHRYAANWNFNLVCCFWSFLRSERSSLSADCCFGWCSVYWAD